jgi:hypothetical protein
VTRRRVALSLAQQAFALRARFPGVHAALSARQLVWIGELQPTSLSRRYTVELTYARQRFPRVRVLDELEVRAGEKSLPHVYSDGSLCLHRDDEWSSQMFLADTILPWAAEWLAHYEIWFATGTWYGGGEWPPRRVGATDASPAGLEGDARRAAAMSLTTKAPLDELPDVVERSAPR